MLLCSSVQDQLAAYNLRDDEGRAQHQAGALREAPAARPRHEDERLADDAHLQVQGRHHLLVAAPDRSHVESALHAVQTKTKLFSRTVAMLRFLGRTCLPRRNQCSSWPRRR